MAILDLEWQNPAQIAAAIGKAHQGSVCDATKKDPDGAHRRRAANCPALQLQGVEFSLPIRYTVPYKCPSEPPIHVEVNRPIGNHYCSQSCL